MNLSHWRAAKDQAGLRICADSPEPSMHVYTKYVYKRRPRPNVRSLALLRTSTWSLIRDISDISDKYQNIECWLKHMFMYTLGMKRLIYYL